MSDTKHTPGPWLIYPGTVHGANAFTGPHIMGDGDDWVVAVLDSGAESNEIADEIDREGRAVTEANARLIAAAPDLLAACVAAKAWLMSEDSGDDAKNWRPLVQRLDAAIAKASLPASGAEGEQTEVSNG